LASDVSRQITGVDSSKITISIWKSEYGNIAELGWQRYLRSSPR
jgi:hypothetical protein